MSDTSTGQTVVAKLTKNFFAAIRQWRIVPMSFVETSLFSRIQEQYLDDEQLRLLQASLLISPDAGPVIKESGGIRKLRGGTESSGKRSSIRAQKSRYSVSSWQVYISLQRLTSCYPVTVWALVAIRKAARSISRG